MEAPLATLRRSGYGAYYTSYSALDRYFRLPSPGALYLLTDAPLVTLAQAFDDVEYPGLPYEDAVIHAGNRWVMIRCQDEEVSLSPLPFTVQELLYDPERDVFLDRGGIYPDLRAPRLVPNRGVLPLHRLAEAASLVSRYHYRTDAGDLSLEGPYPEPDAAFQRQLLMGVMAGDRPDKGLELLYYSGFIEAFWPELQEMSGVAHVKDYHPEGNGWEHTLQTLRYRKTRDLLLSVALLLHDVGKPSASSTPEHPFDGHAELGAGIAERFLKRLRFEAQFVQDACFLVRFHMMPAALKVLPLQRSQPIMGSSLFPRLLELYRADLSASYSGPDGYYEACRIYKNYRKHQANPYRRSDGRKQRWRSLG